MYILVRLFIYLLPSGVIRTKWIERLNIFAEIGNNFYFCPRKLPADPKLIKFHDNVAVAADVMFINHDVSQKMFNYYKSEKLPKFFGCIEIGSNVFIGSRVTILPNIRICDNVFIAAGALITKSISESGIYGGVPAKRIGDIDELYERRVSNYKIIIDGRPNKEIKEILWDLFYDYIEKVEIKNGDCCEKEIDTHKFM